MPNSEKNPKGWYLGLPYIRSGVIRPSRAEKIPVELRGRPAIFCDDVLLQAPNWRELIKDWLDSLPDGGYLILWVKDIRFHDLPPGLQRITQDDLLVAVIDAPSFAVLGVVSMVRGSGARDSNGPAPSHNIVEGDIIDGHAFIVVEKTNWNANPKTPWRKKEKHCLVSRFGANGDALMASSILPGLKAEGWTITMMVRETGFAMLKNDPHIDEFLVLQPQTCLVAERAEFWAAFAPRFDRVINLSQTVEEILLKKPEQGDFYWPDDQRRAMCGGSYLEATHKAAQVPKPYCVKFYPTEEESAWAEKTASGLGKFILWSLQGGAVHKWWPYAPQAIAKLLARTDYTIVLAGDAVSADISNAIAHAAMEYVFDDMGACQNRIKNLINNKSLRETIALAQLADIVIGPETAITNAVSMEAMAKIVFLSHSAASNLTDDWINTQALVPNSPCYPCHRIHFDHSFCPQDDATTAAVCQTTIPAKALIDAVMSIIPASHEAEKMNIGSAKI